MFPPLDNGHTKDDLEQLGTVVMNPEDKKDQLKLPAKRVSAPEASIKMLSLEEQEIQNNKSSGKRPRLQEEPALPRLISKGVYGEDSDELKEYLELCDFIMREASSNLNGMLLRGSSQY